MGNGYFSIVIPALNTSELLQNLLTKLLAQREQYPQTEIIVVDDGSTDDMSFLDAMPIKVKHFEKNRGVAAARNEGLRMATGEWLTFVDSDDDVVDDYLPIIYGTMQAGYDWGSFAYLKDGKSSHFFDTQETLMKRMCTWCYAFRRDITQGYWFDESLNTGEDQVWLHQVLKSGHRFLHSDAVTINYRWDGNLNSIVHRIANKQLAFTRKEFVKGEGHVYKNVFYIRNIGPIGGTETFLENLGKIYGKDFDITVFYMNADPEMLSRIKRYLRVKKYREGEEIRCAKLFVNINTEVMADVVADEKYQIIHADYKVARLTPNTPPDIDHVISVSRSAGDVYTSMTKRKTELCYNPIKIDKPKRALRLISATRLTRDKGAERMRQLADALNRAEIPFVWDVYTDSPDVFRRYDITVRRYKSNILDYVASADYLVQLSDAEGLCYSVEEALCIGVPVIVTDIPAFEELGVVNGVNGWVLPLSMESIPTADIYKGLKKFKYTPPADRWEELLEPGQGTYQEDLKKLRHIVCVKRYFDIEFEKEIHYGERMVVTGRRAEHLVDAGLCKYEKE